MFLLGVIRIGYFSFLEQTPVNQGIIILPFRLVGIAGSHGVAWFEIWVNAFANSRTAFAALAGQLHPCSEATAPSVHPSVRG